MQDEIRKMRYKQSIIWTEDEGNWAICEAFNQLCLRHMSCKDMPNGANNRPDKGYCACSHNVCSICKVKAPDEVQGFFTLVKWER